MTMSGGLSALSGFVVGAFGFSEAASPGAGESAGASRLRRRPRCIEQVERRIAKPVKLGGGGSPYNRVWARSIGHGEVPGRGPQEGVRDPVDKFGDSGSRLPGLSAAGIRHEGRCRYFGRLGDIAKIELGRSEEQQAPFS